MRTAVARLDGDSPAVARPSHWAWQLAMTLPMAALLAGCAGPGQDIANTIGDASLPYVERVEVAAVNPMKLIHDDNVVVYLSGDVTDEQVRELWCTVVVAADPSRLGSGRLSLRKGATFGPQGDVTGGSPVSPPPCDGASSSP